MQERPLQGVRVVECTTMITGPLAGMMLADLGADVIKVEHPEGGDPFRSFRGGSVSPYFLAYNRNKRSIALDLKSESGRRVLEKLLVTADILIENFRPGVLDRLGFGKDRLQKINPNLILCSISGFGTSGPYRDRPAYDAVAQAVSGLSSLFFTPEEPRITGPTIADNLTGIYACYGLLAALHARMAHGRVSSVEVNMLDSAIAFTPDTFLAHTLLGLDPGPYMRVQASQSYALRCRDGAMLSVHLSSQEKFWRACLEALMIPELADDQRFSTRAARVDNYLELARELNAAARLQDRAYWLDRLAALDVPHAPVNSLAEVIDNEQVKHLGVFAQMQHPILGPHIAPRRPVTFNGSREDQPLVVAPEMNAHGEEIMQELELSEADVLSWRENVTAKGVGKGTGSPAGSTALEPASTPERVTGQGGI